MHRCDWGVNNALAGQPSNGSRAYRDRDLSQLGQDFLTEFWTMEGRTVVAGDAAGVAARWLFDGHTVGEQRRIAPLSHLAAARLVSSTFATRLWEATQPRCVLHPRVRGLQYGLSKLRVCLQGSARRRRGPGCQRTTGHSRDECRCVVTAVGTSSRSQCSHVACCWRSAEHRASIRPFWHRANARADDWAGGGCRG